MFVSPSLLKEIITEYRILGWWLSSFNNFKMSLQGVWACLLMHLVNFCLSDIAFMKCLYKYVAQGNVTLLQSGFSFASAMVWGFR